MRATGRRREFSLLLVVKVWRDARALGGTSLALIVLVAVGASLFVTFTQARLNLTESYQTFYGRHHFSDASILVDNAPESLIESARLVPGVTRVVGRAVKDGTIILRDRPRRRVAGRFVGLTSIERSPVNDLEVVRGRYLNSRGEALVEQQFAALNGIQVGDRLMASYLGRRRDFRVVGLAASPEYLYVAPSKEVNFASPQAFGVCWIDEDDAWRWFGLGRRITELHVLCQPGTSARALEILKALGERYGLRSWWDQAEQPSNNLLQMDLKGFMALSVMFPVLFMFAAGLSLYSSLTRIGRMQTGIVGFLRASGFSAREVLGHYVCQGGLLAGAGAVPGVILGHCFSVGMTRLYVSAIHLPGAVVRPHGAAWLTAVLLSMGTGILAAWLPARAAARTSPAVAMRGDQDDRIRGAPWWLGATQRVPVLMRIPLRGLLRRPSRTLFAVGGLVSGTALLLTTVGIWTAVTSAIDELLTRSLRYELEVSLVSAPGQQLVEALGGLPGVEAVYQTCTATVRVVSHRKQFNVQMTGLQPGQRAVNWKTADGRPLALRRGEIWLTSRMAERMGIEPGDPVRVEWAYSSRRRDIHTVLRLGGLLDPGLGAAAYADYDTLRRQMVDRVWPDAGYGAQIVCTPSLGAALRRQLERDDLVAAVVSIQDIRDEVNASLGITLLFTVVLMAFGCTLAGAVLHSVSSVGILERLRELATLRSLGFSARATAATAAVETYAMAGLALLVGLPLGTWMNAQYLKLFETDTMAFKPHLPLWAYVLVSVIVLGLVALSMRGGLQRLRTMDLAQATKARE